MNFKLSLIVGTVALAASAQAQTSTTSTHHRIVAELNEPPAKEQQNDQSAVDDNELADSLDLSVFDFPSMSELRADARDPG